MCTMSDVENKLIDETLEYFKKCGEFDNAIRVNKENREYLKKYIVPAEKVEQNFKYSQKKKAAIGISILAGLMVFGLCMLIMGTSGVIASAVAGGVTLVACMVFFLVMLSKKLNELVMEQDKVNAGINEQMIACDRRVLDLKAQKEDYLNALDDRNLVVIPSKYVQVAEKIAEYVREGNADTVQDAIDQLEQQVKSMRRNRR